MSAKHAIDDKLQGSVATYLRCKKGLLLSVRVKNVLKSVNIWQSYNQERGCLMHFARLANTLLKMKKVAPLFWPTLYMYTCIALPAFSPLADHCRSRVIT